MDYLAYLERLRERVAGTELSFSDDEYAGRVERTRREMHRAGLDALLITDPSDLYYLTGYNTFEVSVHCCLVFGHQRMVLQVPSIETGPAIAGSRVDEVIGYRWEEGRAVAGPLAEHARAIAGSGARIGVDTWSASLRCGVRDALAALLPDAELVDASGLVDGVRIVKSQAEIEMLESSARATEASIDAAAAAVRDGVRDSDVAAAAADAAHRAGSEFMSIQPIVTAGLRSSICHTTHQRHRIARGEPVFIEIGAAWKRYTAPLMRTAVAGTPDDRMRRVHGMCRALYETLIEHIRPGASFDDAAAAAERTLGPLSAEVYFSGVYGYAVGAQFPPSWVEGSGYIAAGQHTEFAENMVFHLPLCLRIPGEWGLGFSETVCVTAAGAEPITRNDWSFGGNA